MEIGKAGVKSYRYIFSSFSLSLEIIVHFFFPGSWDNVVILFWGCCNFKVHVVFYSKWLIQIIVVLGFLVFKLCRSWSFSSWRGCYKCLSYAFRVSQLGLSNKKMLGAKLINLRYKWSGRQHGFRPYVKFIKILYKISFNIFLFKIYFSCLLRCKIIS